MKYLFIFFLLISSNALAAECVCNAKKPIACGTFAFGQDCNGKLCKVNADPCPTKCTPILTSCNALAPACGVTTKGKDNCGGECFRKGEDCPPPPKPVLKEYHLKNMKNFNYTWSANSDGTYNLDIRYEQ